MHRPVLLGKMAGPIPRPHAGAKAGIAPRARIVVSLHRHDENVGCRGDETSNTTPRTRGIDAGHSARWRNVRRAASIRCQRSTAPGWSPVERVAAFRCCKDSSRFRAVSGAGFEPATLELSARCSTRLSYPVASPARFERATSGIADRCSTRLSYGERVRRSPRTVRGGPSGSAPGEPESLPELAIAVPQRRYARRVTKRARCAAHSSNPSPRVGCCSNRASSPHRFAPTSASPAVRRVARRQPHGGGATLRVSPLLQHPQTGAGSVADPLAVRRIDTRPIRHTHDDTRRRARPESKNPRKLASPGVFCTRGGLRRRPPVVGEAYAVVSNPRGIAQRLESPAQCSTSRLGR